MDITELFAPEELEEALAQIERGEVYTIEEVEAELEEEFAKEFDEEMEQAWQEMLNGGGTPFEEFLEEFEKEY